jgi:hypothetical protein
MWEVFEVQRSSHKAEAVSAGLEQGWLAFVSPAQKRRLAPFPSSWHSADAVELERLCGLARAARPTGIPRRDRTSDGTEAPRTRVPRIRRSQEFDTIGAADDQPIGSTPSSADPVEQTVRIFAQQARARRLPAVAAMIELKALLARVYTEPTSSARDLRAVRHWFVESYYFDGADSTRPAIDQSR